MDARFLGLVGSANASSPTTATGILFSAPTKLRDSCIHKVRKTNPCKPLQTLNSSFFT